MLNSLYGRFAKEKTDAEKAKQSFFRNLYNKQTNEQASI